MFAHSVELDPAALEESLTQLPARRGVFALEFGGAAEPYVTQTSDIRRRARRLLEAPTASSRRLSLRAHAQRISYACTGSQLETTLLLCRRLRDPRQRLKLRPPPLIRFAIENRYPRGYVSTRLSLRAADSFFGPFASRVAAENYLESVLDLFLLRRCQPDLLPDPAFPGCIYSEMHKCLAPCFAGCSDARYAEEAEAVLDFLKTRGESLFERLGAERDAASGELDFEKAAALHAKVDKVKAVAQSVPEIVRAVSTIDMLILEPSAEPETVNLFLFRNLRFSGPVAFSTLDMRHASEQNTSSSLFAQPLSLAPLPLEGDAPAPTASLDDRLRAALTELEQKHAAAKPQGATAAQDELAILRRWYFRPDGKKSGEGFLRERGAGWPERRILRAVSRVYLGRTNLAAAPQHL